MMNQLLTSIFGEGVVGVLMLTSLLGLFVYLIYRSIIKSPEGRLKYLRYCPPLVVAVFIIYYIYIGDLNRQGYDYTIKGFGLERQELTWKRQGYDSADDYNAAERERERAFNEFARELSSQDY